MPTDNPLQEFRKLLRLPPTDAHHSQFEPPAVQPNPAEFRAASSICVDVPTVFTEAPPYLRKMPCPVDQSDASLCRFLRARQYDVQKAEKMYTAFIENREKWQLDSILDEDDPLEEFWLRCVPNAHYCYDKIGRPVLYER